MMSSTVFELPLQGLPFAVQNTVQLNWVAVCGTSSVPVAGLIERDRVVRVHGRSGSRPSC